MTSKIAEFYCLVNVLLLHINDQQNCRVLLFGQRFATTHKWPAKLRWSCMWKFYSNFFCSMLPNDSPIYLSGSMGNLKINVSKIQSVAMSCPYSLKVEMGESFGNMESKRVRVEFSQTRSSQFCMGKQEYSENEMKLWSSDFRSLFIFESMWSNMELDDATWYLR